MFSILTTLINQRKIKISDFGLSEMIDHSLRTFVGEIPAYMEPQLFISNEYCLDEKSDVYSLGVFCGKSAVDSHYLIPNHFKK